MKLGPRSNHLASIHPSPAVHVPLILRLAQAMVGDELDIIRVAAGARGRRDGDLVAYHDLFGVDAGHGRFRDAVGTLVAVGVGAAKTAGEDPSEQCPNGRQAAADDADKGFEDAPVGGGDVVVCG